MTRHALGRRNEGVLAIEQTVQRDSFKLVALWGRSSVCINVVDVVDRQACILQSTTHSEYRTVVAGLWDATAVGRESVTSDLGQNGGTTADGAVVILKQ